MALLGLCSSAWVSHCSGFSCYGAQALGAQASVIAIQPSPPLSTASPPTFNLPQHQGLFQ